MCFAKRGLNWIGRFIGAYCCQLLLLVACFYDYLLCWYIHTNRRIRSGRGSLVIGDGFVHEYFILWQIYPESCEFSDPPFSFPIHLSFFTESLVMLIRC